MNKRIKELAEQASHFISDLERVQIYSMMEIHNMYNTKFAELIVRECCDMVNKHHQYNNPNECLLVLDIKEHFGVEE